MKQQVNSKNSVQQSHKGNNCHETNSQTHANKDHSDFGLAHHLLPALADVCHVHALGHLPVWISPSILPGLGTMPAGTKLLRVQRAMACIGYSLLVCGQRGDCGVGEKESKVIQPTEWSSQAEIFTQFDQFRHLLDQTGREADEDKLLEITSRVRKKHR